MAIPLRDGQGFIDLNDMSLSVQIDGVMHRVRWLNKDDVSLRIGAGPETLYRMPLLTNTRKDQVLVWLVRALRGVPQFFARAKRQAAEVSAGA